VQAKSYEPAARSVNRPRRLSPRRTQPDNLSVLRGSELGRGSGKDLSAESPPNHSG